MKKLIIVRHGHYLSGGNNSLSERGREQMRLLGIEIRTNHTVDGEKVGIITSTAKRAAESANIIGDIFGTPAHQHEVLWSENDRPTNIDEALEIIDSEKETDVLIAVTHLEYAQELPVAFGRKVLGAANFPDHGLNKGEAWVIDCEQKSFKKIHMCC